MDKPTRVIEVYHRKAPDIYDVYELDQDNNPTWKLSFGHPDNILKALMSLSLDADQPILVRFIDQTIRVPKSPTLVGGEWPNMERQPMPVPSFVVR